MKYEDLEAWSIKAAQWAAEYHRTLRDRPVRPEVHPGDFAQQIPATPPESAESVETVFEDFVNMVPGGMTHWQHPRFFAYFNSNASAASMLAEQLANAISAQCMLWQTSPAATELETCMIDWFRQSLGLPVGFAGVIQDSASSSTLSAVLTMRERALQWEGIHQGLSSQSQLRIYASDQTHSSVDKAIRIAGIGQQNLVKIPTDENWAMRPDALQHQIRLDREDGFLPAGLIGCIGGTSIGASDRLDQILSIAQQENLYSHVDAAWAGAAMICPELRDGWDGIELADSIVVNPHKWIGANFDCSIQFLKDPELQVRTLSMRPDYLKTLEQDYVVNYSEWCVPLGRRFRALKLWFLFRIYGLDGLRNLIRNHLEWATWAADKIGSIEQLQIVTPPMYSLFTFRVHGEDAVVSDAMTKELIESINRDGRIYLTQTSHEGEFVIRMTMGQFEATREDVEFAVDVIREMTGKLAATRR